MQHKYCLLALCIWKEKDSVFFHCLLMPCLITSSPIISRKTNHSVIYSHSTFVMSYSDIVRRYFLIVNISLPLPVIKPDTKQVTNEQMSVWICDNRSLELPPRNIIYQSNYMCLKGKRNNKMFYFVLFGFYCSELALDSSVTGSFK